MKTYYIEQGYTTKELKKELDFFVNERKNKPKCKAGDYLYFENDDEVMTFLNNRIEVLKNLIKNK